jgi:hypothetical protein
MNVTHYRLLSSSSTLHFSDAMPHHTTPLSHFFSFHFICLPSLLYQIRRAVLQSPSPSWREVLLVLPGFLFAWLLFRPFWSGANTEIQVNIFRITQN